MKKVLVDQENNAERFWDEINERAEKGDQLAQRLAEMDALHREAVRMEYLSRRKLGVRAVPGLRPQDQEEAGILVSQVQRGEASPGYLRDWIEWAKRTNRVRRKADR